MSNNNLSSADKTAARYYYPENVSVKERQFSLLVGTGMALWGLLNGGLKNKSMLLPLGAYLLKRGATGQCAVYRLAGRSTASADVQSHVVIEKSITISRSLADTYAFWRNIAQLPQYLHFIETAVPLNETKTSWKLNTTIPLPLHRAWTIELTREQAPTLIVFHALPSSNLELRGSLRFSELPNDRGTEVKLTIAYAPRGGDLARNIAELNKAAVAQGVKDEMMRLKQVMEAGEISTTRGQPQGPDMAADSQNGVVYRPGNGVGSL